MILSSIRKEYEFYRAQSENSRDLLISFIAYGAAIALIGIFFTAYLWSKTNDLNTVALFFIVSYCALPLTFIINGLLLRRFAIKKLYMLGLVALGISPVILVFANEVTPGLVLFLGVVDGFSNGLYWANRNYLTIEGVQDKDRNYFFGINYAFDTLSGVGLPILVGFFIDKIGQSVFGSTDIPYKIVMLLGLGIFSYSAYLLNNDKFANPKIEQLLLNENDYDWWLVRALSFFFSIPEGLLFFFPVLLVLIFVGTEGELGAVETVTALLGVIATYILGRTSSEKQRAPLIYASGLAMLLSALVFVFLVGQPDMGLVTLGALVFVAVGKIFRSILGVNVPALWYEAIDRHASERSADRYKYIVDVEIFLNFGRLVAILSFVLLVVSLGKELALQFTPLIMVVGQIGMIISTRLLDDGLRNKRNAAV